MLLRREKQPDGKKETTFSSLRGIYSLLHFPQCDVRDIYIVCVWALSCVMAQNKTISGDRSGSPKLEEKQHRLVQTLYAWNATYLHKETSKIGFLCCITPDHKEILRFMNFSRGKNKNTGLSQQLKVQLQCSRVENIRVMAPRILSQHPKSQSTNQLCRLQNKKSAYFLPSRTTGGYQFSWNTCFDISSCA